MIVLFYDSPSLFYIFIALIKQKKTDLKKEDEIIGCWFVSNCLLIQIFNDQMLARKHEQR